MTERQPVVSGAQLVAVLGKLGWVSVRQRGSHVRLKHADRPSRWSSRFTANSSAARWPESCATQGSRAARAGPAPPAVPCLWPPRCAGPPGPRRLSSALLPSAPSTSSREVRRARGRSAVMRAV
ncbi:MAG: type II toxin-antitoxin system HicA family toxin [Mycobacteriales bacterium]